MSDFDEREGGLCIYHGGCTDGVAAAWAVWRAHPDWAFWPGVHQQGPPMDLIRRASDVVIVDFSYKRSVMELIASASQSVVVVLDHHDTARDDLLPLLETGTLTGVFDNERCGARIAWDYFHGDSGKSAPALLPYIDARDRWVEGPEGLNEIIIALRSYPHAPDSLDNEGWAQFMRQWDYLMTSRDMRELREAGEHIQRYYRARVDETNPHAQTVTIRGLELPLVNAPYYLASDVAGELAKISPSGVAAVWWRNKGGTVTFSVRARGDFHAGQWCEREFGGGGHKGAAGFTLSWAQFIALLGAQ